MSTQLGCILGMTVLKYECSETHQKYLMNIFIYHHTTCDSNIQGNLFTVTTGTTHVCQGSNMGWFVIKHVYKKDEQLYS